MKYQDYVNADFWGRVWIAIRWVFIRPLKITFILIFLLKMTTMHEYSFFYIFTPIWVFSSFVNYIHWVLQWDYEEKETKRGQIKARKEQLRQKKYEDEYGLVETWSWKDKK